MSETQKSTQILDLLNRALARELQVSVQYMLQHGMGAAWLSQSKDAQTAGERFIATKWPYFLPGKSLKKVAITEMRHAEAITERIVLLGGTPTREPDPILPGESAEEMLARNRELEVGAIALYRQVIQAATDAGDDVTAKLFESILRDEEEHERQFADLIAEA